MAYDQLLAQTSEAAAVKQYLKILHAAKHEGLEVVDDVLRWFLSDGKAIAAKEILEVVQSKQQIPGPTDVNVEAPDLCAFDSLLPHKDVYDEKASQVDDHEVDQQDSRIEESCLIQAQLEAYDRHAEAVGAIEGTASTDVPGTASSRSRTGGARGLDAHSVPVGSDDPGMPSEAPESHRTIDAKLESVSGEDLGAIPMVSASPACDAAVRDASQRRLLGPPGQPADFRQTGFWEDKSAIRVRRPTGAARALGLLLDVPDVSPGTAACETGFTYRTVDQEAAQVRSTDHRRLGVCPAEPRRDGGVVHTPVGTLRARQCVTEQQPTVLQVGTDLQRSHDDCCSDRPIDPSFGDHRAEYSKLSPGSGQAEQEASTRFTGIKTWLRRIAKFQLPLGRPNCR